MKNDKLNLIGNIEITSCTFAIKQDSDENVSEAQDTADGVDDVMLGSTVVRDEDSAEIMEYIILFDDNFNLLTLE